MQGGELGSRGVQVFQQTRSVESFSYSLIFSFFKQHKSKLPKSIKVFQNKKPLKSYRISPLAQPLRTPLYLLLLLTTSRAPFPIFFSFFPKPTHYKPYQGRRCIDLMEVHASMATIMFQFHRCRDGASTAWRTRLSPWN